MSLMSFLIRKKKDSQVFIDPTDESLEGTALRETFEEIGYPPQSIDLLGRYSAVPNKTGSLRVHPFVGFIKDKEIDLTRFNPDEVSRVFTLPVEYLIDRKNREIKQFRNSSIKYPVFKVPNDIQEGEKEIWGLTSFILDGNSCELIRKVFIFCL